uniref:DUF4211 domain-containing protein n=1 Tax=Strigamia maritima TaxID=126957 RepID=T1JDV3_STRMM
MATRLEFVLEKSSPSLTMEHPGPWSAYGGQHYPRLGTAGTNPLSQTGQLNELNLPRQDPMASYAAPGASTLLLPTHHTINAASQGVAHTDPSFVNTANHLLSPSYHDAMLGSFPATNKGHHPLTPLNMAPHPHSGAIFKNLGKETEINELRGGFSRRSANLPVTNATSGVSGIGAMASSGLFNSQSSPHSWRAPDIMPTPSSPFGVLPHETVMHRSNANTPTSSTPKPHQNQPQSNKPRSESNTMYMEEHAGYRNVLGLQGAMLDNNSRSPALIMAAVQPEVVPPLGSLKSSPEYGVGVYHGTSRGALLPQNYLTHAQFPPLEVHGDKRDIFSPPHQHQSPCAGPASTQTIKQTSEIFSQQQQQQHQVTSVSASIPQSASNASQGSPAPSINQSAILQRSPQVIPNVSSASPSHPRDLSNYSTFPTTPSIPTHSQSFLANQMPSAMEFNGSEQARTTPLLQAQTQGAPPSLTCQNQYPSPSASQMNHGSARVTGLGPMYPMSVPTPTTYDPMMTNLDKNNKLLTPPLTQCMINNNNINNNNNNGISMEEPTSVYGGPQVPINAAPASAANNLELNVPLQEMEEDGKEDSKRKRKRRRSRRDSNEPRITPMTPVQANKLSHKMAPPLSVPLHHPPVTSPLTPMDLSGVETSDAFHHLSQNVQSESNPATNDGASTSAPSSLSPSETANLSPPQLPSTPASVSNPGSVPEKRNSLLNLSIEDDLGFLAELPPACNIRHQKRAAVMPGTWSQRPNNGSFQDVFMKFVKGNVTMMGFVEQKKSTRGRGRGAACAASSSRRLSGSESGELNASSSFFGLSANCKLENVKFESLKPTVFAKKETPGTVNPSEVMVPNPEAPKFSSDDDFSPMGLESLVHSAIQGLSDGEEEGTAVREQVQRAAESRNGHLRDDESEKQNPIKIKLVGLHSGNVQTAKRGRGRRRKSQVKMEVEDGCDVKEKMDNVVAPGTPVRRASMRKCKEVVMQRRNEAYVSSDSDKDGNDSDCDPAWTPLDKVSEPKARIMSSDEDKKKKYIPKKPLPLPTLPIPKRRGRPPKLRPDDSMAMTPAVAEEDTRSLDEQDGFGKLGDFVVAVADMVKEHPPIWRVDGKALLQKFEAFEQDGRVLYKNKSTYAGWTCNSRAQYQTIQVRLVQSKKCTVVVEWERVDCNSEVDNNALEAPEPEIEFIPQKESFEVYLQTLISQVLDPNFISEIIKEQDEYFLSHVNVVDTMVERCKQQVLDTVSWLPQFRETIERSPRLSVSGFSEQSDSCYVCQRQEMLKKAIFSRLDYDDVTLAYTQPITGDGVTQFKLCSRCADMVWLYSQVHHQKFNFYHQCTAKVLEMREADPSKESHIILQYCLLDGIWINKLLKEVQSTWQRCLRLKR